MTELRLTLEEKKALRLVALATLAGATDNLAELLESSRDEAGEVMDHLLTAARKLEGSILR